MSDLGLSCEFGRLLTFSESDIGCYLRMVLVRALLNFPPKQGFYR